ncbi:LacI family DNA-binding transcriptional regulator [Nonomuraea sp. NPDC049309]|uniref:LacI family DNA-binding transcriptional regulator n=1 Tax=Nonomuraea sp. NPDC049309 TaxID=3364350 RepID=UPI003720022F
MSMAAEPTGDGDTRSRPLTIAQLAELAQVSTATVSKVVNGRSEVRPETRALIERLIREHGYRPQRRRATFAPLVELVFGDLDGEAPSEVAAGVERVTREHRLGVSVSRLRHGDVPWIEGVLSRRPTGVISVFSDLTGTEREQLAARGIPLVLLDPRGEPPAEVVTVGASDWSAGLMATRHLLSLGHRRIAALAGPADSLAARARLDGYRTALDMAGVPAAPELITAPAQPTRPDEAITPGEPQPITGAAGSGLRTGGGSPAASSGEAEVERLLRLPSRPTAILTCADGQAAAVYRAAHRLGLRIPGDLSVVGFDAPLAGRWMDPPLTTVRRPLSEMAATAADMLLRLARGEHPARPQVELGADLILRGSTTAAAA